MLLYTECKYCWSSAALYGYLSCITVCRLSVCTSVCLSVCLPFCLSVCFVMSVCLSVCMSVCLCMYVCLSVCPSVCLYLSLSVYLLRSSITPLNPKLGTDLMQLQGRQMTDTVTEQLLTTMCPIFPSCG
jgi:hypothetical protein